MLRSLVQLVIMEIDADDWIRSSELSTDHDSESDAPNTKDNHRLARFDFGVVVDDAKPGGERVGEQSAQLEFGIGRNFG